MSLRYGLAREEPCVFVTDNALDAMLRFRQFAPGDKEAGGQLFAQFSGRDVVIVEATTPTLLDRRSRYSFVPNRLLQRRQIRQKHADGLHFVGDWHTHPEEWAKPSEDDVASMKDCFRRSRHDLRAFVCIIVGIAPPPEGWHVSLITTDGARQLHAVKRDVHMN